MPDAQIKLSIVVPCYNEAGNLLRLLEAFRKTIGGEPGIEVLLVNNGSTDGSAEVLNAAFELADYAFAREVAIVRNEGYGFGILSGLRQARGEYLAWTHADLQTDPADVIRGFRALEKSRNPRRTLVRGVRHGRPLFDRAFTVGMGFFASVVLGSKLYDINGQPKIFHRSLLRSMDDAPWDFSLDLYVLQLANSFGLQTIDLVVDFGRRDRGESKGGGTIAGKFRLVRRTIPFIIASRSRRFGRPDFTAASENA